MSMINNIRKLLLGGITSVPIPPTISFISHKKGKGLIEKIIDYTSPVITVNGESTEVNNTTPENYTVKKGDSPWKIANENGITLEELYRWNPNARKMIHPGDVLRLGPTYTTERVDLREEEKNELLLDNIGAIQSFRHLGNYVIVDKKNRLLTVYDKDNNVLYKTLRIATGESGDDYNTITYVDDKGHIVNKKGNNSTPAGITVIDGIGTYHGYPSFIRSRINRDGTKENIASSFHWGNIGTDKNASNGCVRINGLDLIELSKYIGVGTMVYTLPELEGSKFTLRNGHLNFTADNPYGNDDKGPKRFWDDYNVNIDRTYSPLTINFLKSSKKDYNENREKFSKALVKCKNKIQKQFGLSSYEYNKLAELALGIAEQETKFGTSTRYRLKLGVGEWAINIIKSLLGNNSVNSKGMTQIKIDADNLDLRRMYRAARINKDTIESPSKSAEATMIRLAYMYKNEVIGRDFIGLDGEKVNPYIALLYKWNGHNELLKNKTATPNKNIYINNVNRYLKNFNLSENRTYEV